MHGLQDTKGDTYIELSGYEILITTEKGELDKEKDINKLKKKYKLKTILREYSDTEINRANKVIEAEVEIKDKANLKGNIVCYLFTQTDKKLLTIFMQTINQRDTLLEKAFVKAYINNELSDYISADLKADTISFAGREIVLGSACSWHGPHNIYCMGGQISWAEFPTFEAAEADINKRIEANNNDKLIVLKEEDIDVIFEDIPSLVHRVVYQQNSQSFYSPRRTPLVVYYIVQEVRGRFVSCVMSNYGYNKNDYELSPLLQEIMSIPEIPESAYNPFDIPEPDEIPEEIANKHRISLFEFRTGAWVPVGNLSKVYKVAPSVELFLGFPIKSDMTIDLGLQFAFPANRNYFDFYHKGEEYGVKTNLLGNISLRWRYEQVLAKNIYWTNYLGAGVGILQTNLEDWEADDDGVYHSVETLDVFGGVGIKYKKVGCFLEYHFLPYSIAGKVRRNLGNSMINAGLFVAF